MDIDSYATDEEKIITGAGASSLSPYKNQNWFKNKNKSEAPGQSGNVPYISTLDKSPS